MSLFLSCRSFDLLEGLDYALLLGQIQSEGKRSTDRKNKDMTPIIAAIGWLGLLVANGSIAPLDDRTLQTR